MSVDFEDDDDDDAQARSASMVRSMTSIPPIQGVAGKPEIIGFLICGNVSSSRGEDSSDDDAP